MHDNVSLRTVDQHGGVITLHPRVAAGLGRLSGMLRPTLEILWVRDVLRMNSALQEGHVDAAGHLFGRERVALGRVRAAYFDEFGASCATAGPGSPRTAPLTICCRGPAWGLAGWPTSCRPAGGSNSSKSSALPGISLSHRVLGRGSLIDLCARCSTATELRLGPDFLATLSSLEGVDRSKVVAVTVDIITDLVNDLDSRELHPLREGDGAAARDVVRASDGARCKRVALQRKTASARRLHFWKVGDAIELSRVVKARRYDAMTRAVGRFGLARAPWDLGWC